MKLRYILMTLVMFLIALAVTEAYSSPASYYNLSIDTKDYFSSNDGTAYNAVLNSSFGNRGGSYYFDGNNDSIDLGTDSSINFNSSHNFSISAWIYSLDGSTQRYITYKDGDYGIHTQGGKLCFQEREDSFVNVCTASTELGVENEWVHYVVTFDESNSTGKRIRFYKNGTEYADDNGDNDFDFSGTDGTFLISRDSATSARHGFVDDFHIYNYTMTGADVLRDYRATLNNKNSFDSEYNVFYFSNSGDDSDECTQTNPCQTITYSNSLPYFPGANVTFYGGDLWRPPIDAWITPVSGVTYNSYGTGKGIIYGSFNMSSTGNWSDEGSNIWNSSGNISLEVGVIVNASLDGLDRVDTMADLDAQGEFLYNYTEDVVRIYSVDNPATVYSGGLEVAVGGENPDAYGFLLDSVNGITIENLELKNFGAGAISGTEVEGIIIRNNEIGWCGGIYISGQSGLRYGDCVGLGMAQENIYIGYNNISDSSDACLTYQSWLSAGIKTIENITVEYNLLRNCPYGIVIFSSDTGSTVNNTRVIHNTFDNIGDTYADWSNVAGRRGVRVGLMPYDTHNFNMTNNIFNDYVTFAIDLGDDTTTRYKGESPTIDYNLYDGDTSYIVSYNATEYSTVNAFIAGEGKEINGAEADPIFNNESINDYHPVNGSIACTMSSTGSYVGAFPCVANVTVTPSNTTGEWDTQTVLSNESITMNLTFTQPPYIVSSNLTVNLTSITSYVNTSTANSVTTSGSVSNPDNSNDNDYDTYAQSAGGSGSNVYIYHNYTGNNNAWYDSDTYVYWKSEIKGGLDFIRISCWTGSAWSVFGTAVGIYDSTVWNERTRTDNLPTSCIDSNDDIQFRFQLHHDTRGAGYYGTRLHDLEIYREYYHYAHIEDHYIYNTSNETERFETYNVTSLVQNQSDDNIVYFTFGSGLNITIWANVTVDYIYNKSMIFNVFDQLTSNLMNVTCTFNNASLGRNETFNTTFVSYDENIFRCSEPGYVNTSYEVGYPFDEVNMTMERPQAFECADLPNEALAYNFTVYDEDNWTILYGNDIYVDLTFGSSILSFEKENTSFLEICIANGQSYEVDGFLQLENGYVTKYFLRSANFDNVTNEIRVFNKESVTAYSDLVITLRDSSFLPYSNVIGRLQRYYPANHSWITVQQDDSDQFGQVFYSIIEKNVEYRLLFYADTTLLDSTEKIKLICDSGLCQVSFQVSPDEDEQDDLNIITALDSTLRVIDVNWTDATGETASLRVLVTKETMTGTIGICDSSIYSSTGAYQCNVSDYTGGLQLTVYTPADDDTPTLNELLTLADVSLGDFLSITQSAFWSFVILLLFIGVGLVSPVAVIIFTMFGIFVISLLGINPVVDVMFLVVAGVMGIAIGVKVKK